MDSLMSSKEEFMQIGRRERVSCIKQLGTRMEKRKLSLLRKEVERSLELISR